MYTDGMMLFLICVCVVMLAGVVSAGAFKFAAGLAARGILGMAAVFAADFLLSPWNIAVGFNCFTAAVSALLGLPGTAMLLGWAVIFETFL